MNPILDIRFSKLSGYGGSKYYRCSQDDFHVKLLSSIMMGRDSNCVFTTQLPKKHFFNRKEAILALDCDSEGERDRAVRFLQKVVRCKTYCVSSSAGHFWVFTNYVGRLSDVYSKMLATPGSDYRHVDAARICGRPIFRAWPKAANEYPIFPDIPADFSNDSRVMEWLSAFREYFQGDFYQELKIEKGRRDLESLLVRAAPESSTTSPVTSAPAPPEPKVRKNDPKPLIHRPKYDLSSEL